MSNAKKPILASLLAEYKAAKRINESLSRLSRSYISDLGVDVCRWASFATDETPIKASTLSPVEEAIVASALRPSLIVRNNQLEIPQSDETWTSKLTAARSRIEAILSSVGRVELRNHPTYEMLGTGWLVAPNVVITNRHIASVFARASNSGFVFRRNLSGEVIETILDFREELNVPEADEFVIEDIIDIQPDTDDVPDMAFLRVSTSGTAGERLSTPITLSNVAPGRGQEVITIGYPAWDGERNPMYMDRIFGNTFQVKRAAPGKVSATSPTVFEHDCSTLGGNSGSVVLDLSTGHAVGLHFAGKFLVANYAVPASIIANRLRELRLLGSTESAAINTNALDALLKNDEILASLNSIIERERGQIEMQFIAQAFCTRYPDFVALLQKPTSEKLTEEPITATVVAAYTIAGFAAGVLTRWLSKKSESIADMSTELIIAPGLVDVVRKAITHFKSEEFSTRPIVTELQKDPRELSAIIPRPGITEEPVSLTILATAFLTGAIVGAKIFDGKWFG